MISPIFNLKWMVKTNKHNIFIILHYSDTLGVFVNIKCDDKKIFNALKKETLSRKTLSCDKDDLSVNIYFANYTYSDIRSQSRGYAWEYISYDTDKLSAALITAFRYKKFISGINI